MKDVYQVKESLNNSEVVTVNYVRPKFWHRVMANFVDIFLMLLLFVGLFVGTRAIVQNTAYYKNKMSSMHQMQLDSGLYVANPGNDVSGGNIDIIYYLDTYKAIYGHEFDGVSADGGEPIGKNGLAVKAINKFIDFCQSHASNDRYLEIIAYYEQARLEPTLNGIHYFIKEGDDIFASSLADSANNLSAYYDNVFKKFIESRCLPFLTSNIPEYSNIVKIDYRFLLFVELPIAYLLSGFIVYFIPPLFFRHGRMTLGKALYHIGLIDERVLSPTFIRFTARFMIFYFGELVLSLFTLGIPYIISFSLMAFSKNKQGFPDYMLRIYEVDTSKTNIYIDYVEAQLKNELHGEPVDFKMEKPL